MEPAMPQPKTKPPKRYLKFQKNFPKVGNAYETLGETCHGTGPLDFKTRELIKLGIACGAFRSENFWHHLWQTTFSAESILKV